MTDRYNPHCEAVVDGIVTVVITAVVVAEAVVDGMVLVAADAVVVGGWVKVMVASTESTIW